jgi:amino acid adenylation domain-containing protein
MNERNYSEQFTIAAGQHIKEKEYWLAKLSAVPLKTVFPYDDAVNTTSKNQRRTAKKRFKLIGRQFSRLVKLSNNSDVRLYIILAASLVLLLKKYTFSEKKDILIGSPIYKQKIETQFINTIVTLRNRVVGEMTFRKLLLQVQETIIEAMENYSYPITLLPVELNIPFSRENDFPLFDVALLLENIQSRNYIRDININVIFSFFRTADSIDGIIEYNSFLYRRDTIENLIRHYEQLLEVILNDPEVRLDEVEIMLEEEKINLLYDFNHMKTRFPGKKTIQQLFEEQVELAPGAAALEFAGKWLSYCKLNEKANKLARLLREKGIGKGSIVAIMLDRSLEMVITILAILKAGGSYLPVEPGQPESRILSLLEDSKTSLLITNSTGLGNKSFMALQGGQPRDAAVYKTAPRPQITDIEALPRANRSLVDYERYNRYIGQAAVKNSITLQATRGCPFNCAYCHKIWPKKHVFRSARDIFEEVLVYYKMGVRKFSFVDDIFNLNRENSNKFFRLIIDNGLNLHLFFCNGVRADLLTEEDIDLMIKAGAVNFAFALETASPRIQKLIGKNMNLEKFRKNIEYICKKYPEIILELFTMHGFPTETEEDALKTLDFMKSIKWVHFPYVFILKIYPNTDMETLAIENGISQEAIARSMAYAYHELPETLPFSSSFTLKYQGDFFNEYFLSKERLMSVLPYQMRLFTEDELVQKYNGYLPADINSFSSLLKFFDIPLDELEVTCCLAEDSFYIPNFNEKLRSHFPGQEPLEDALKVLILDLTLFFSHERSDRFDSVIEPPLGPIYILTYLQQQYGNKVSGKIAKSGIDFEDYSQLKRLLEEFEPDVIGIRSLTYHKNLFHSTVSTICQWGIDVPVITGGPYATSSYKSILHDTNVDLVVLGEGEITFSEIIGKIIENNGSLPDHEVLKEIKGIAFMPQNNKQTDFRAREIVMLETLENQLNEKSGSNLEQINHPSDLAYVIYTSGSSGIPRGVLIQHKNVVQLLLNDKPLFDFTNRDTWTMFHSYAFDFSVWEMYGALLYGGRLVIVPHNTALDPEKFSLLLENQMVTVLNQTPSAFYSLMSWQLKDPCKTLHLRYVIFGGEALNPGKLKMWKEKYPAHKLINMYGITETTVHVTYKEIDIEDIQSGISMIGKPIPTLCTFVMDQNMKLVPINVPGELCVAGAGVGRGYLNDPMLTNQRFVRNPYKQGECLYRSGDLVRLIRTGEMEYLGRIDSQVKIRGFRIELGEIQNTLLKHEHIMEAVVVVNKAVNKNNSFNINGSKDPEKFLCAYIAAKQKLDSNELKTFLSYHLPGYMIPVYFIRVEKMPLTPNGKVDKKKLLNLFTRQSSNVYNAPTSHIEKSIANIWQEELAIEKVDIYDNFFDIGGNSINIVRIHNKIMDIFAISLPVLKMFEYPTISSLAQYLNRELNSSKSMTNLNNVDKPLPGKDEQYVSFNKNKHMISRRKQLIKTGDRTT